VLSQPRPHAGAVEQLADLIRGADSVVALTGAGVSVPSGIPDFRSAGTGLWEGVDPMQVAHIDAFHADAERFWAFYSERFATLEDKQPNDAHRALAQLERQGMLDGVITQNIDMLHRKAGTEELIELHGSIERCVCLRCRIFVPLGQARALIAGDPAGVPRCPDCDAPLKPDVVLFGELLDDHAAARARELCQRADVLLCVGTSLEVYPAAELPMITHRAGGRVAIITKSPTPLDRLGHIRLDGDVVDELGALSTVLDGHGDSA
jgi:NAD-dependent deacetylase